MGAGHYLWPLSGRQDLIWTARHETRTGIQVVGYLSEVFEATGRYPDWKMHVNICTEIPDPKILTQTQNLFAIIPSTTNDQKQL
jgi:hypothetical protein